MIEPLGEGAMLLDEIEVGPRLRPVSEAGVAQLIASIEALGGHMTDPVQVRTISGQQGRATRHVLMAGAHRLEAARRLGWPQIRARRWRCNDAEAAIFEIDDNLASAELTALDRAVFMAARRRAFLKVHPERRAGVAGGLAKAGKLQPEFIPFAQETAERHGKSVSWAEKYLIIGERLSTEDVAAARAAGIHTSFVDLYQLSRLSPERRAPVLATMVERGLTRVKSAERALIGKPAPDPVETTAWKIYDAFNRAPMKAKRRALDWLLGNKSCLKVIREALAELDVGAGEPGEGGSD